MSRKFGGAILFAEIFRSGEGRCVMDNEWKSDLALMLPFVVFLLIGGISMSVMAVVDGNVEIERLRLAQMQYQSQFVKPSEGERR